MSLKGVIAPMRSSVELRVGMSAAFTGEGASLTVGVGVEVANKVASLASASLCESANVESIWKVILKGWLCFAMRYCC